LKDIFADHHVEKVGFDPWGYTHFRPSLERAGFSERVLEQTFVEFVQGTKSMTPALRELESLILERKIRHGDHPVLKMCMANAVVEGSAENRKLSKKRSSGRIDGAVAVALAMAIGVAPAARKVKFDAFALIG
jgi:phage terminase large subunit-like protein